MKRVFWVVVGVAVPLVWWMFTRKDETPSQPVEQPPVKSSEDPEPAPVSPVAAPEPSPVEPQGPPVEAQPVLVEEADGWNLEATLEDGEGVVHAVRLDRLDLKEAEVRGTAALAPKEKARLKVSAAEGKSGLSLGVVVKESDQGRLLLRLGATNAALKGRIQKFLEEREL